MPASSVFRLTPPPAVTGVAAMWWGYAKSRLKGEARYDDEEFRKFLRRYQLACLVKGKAKATAELEAEMAPRFQP